MSHGVCDGDMGEAGVMCPNLIPREVAMEPIIVTAQFDPNPAGEGGVTLLRVVALDAETSPAGVVHQSGEFRAGEV